MKLEIEVKRIRGSVTQGEAAVYVNGEKVIQFGDRIEIIKEGQPYYSEKIGGWASVKPDADFIKGLLWHPFDDMYHYSDKVKEILDADTERMKGMDWNIEKTEGILEEIRVREGFKEFLAMAVLRFIGEWLSRRTPPITTRIRRRLSAPICTRMK